uniref:Uncharacterized protein n=1 Tax=Knipowitschia caucasica TaxID=637954 RepID=A0AAV2KSZ9_KNICA
MPESGSWSRAVAVVSVVSRRNLVGRSETQRDSARPSSDPPPSWHQQHGAHMVSAWEERHMERHVKTHDGVSSMWAVDKRCNNVFF